MTVYFPPWINYLFLLGLFNAAPAAHEIDIHNGLGPGSLPQAREYEYVDVNTIDTMNSGYNLHTFSTEEKHGMTARLSNEHHLVEGTVMLKYPYMDTMLPMCSDDMNNTVASRICEMIGYPQGGEAVHDSDESGVRVSFGVHVQCSDDAPSFHHCTNGLRKCQLPNPAVVRCYTPSSLKTTPPELQPSLKPELEIETTLEPELELETTLEPELVPEATLEPELKLETTLEPVLEPETTLELELELETTLEPQLKLETTIEPELKPETTPEPELVLETTLEPELILETTLEPQLKLQTTLEPELETETPLEAMRHVCGIRPYDMSNLRILKSTAAAAAKDNLINILISKRDKSKETHLNIALGERAHYGKFPWQVGFRNKAYPSEHFCGGTILSEFWVLSAAHCFDRIWTNAVRIYVGDNSKTNFDEAEQIFDANKIIKHEHFYEEYDTGVWNDIALVQIKPSRNGRGILFNSFVQPACLPPPATTYKNNQHCLISGWGRTYSDSDSEPEFLLGGTAYILPWNNCQHRFRFTRFSKNMMCAAGTAACRGDSGGPLVCKSHGTYTLAGITSWTAGDCGTSYPTVFTDVRKYLHWIDGTIAKHSTTKFQRILPPRPTLRA